jgi:crotonobetainyl-CoA:carnitine CoA-transferase CaiB-like acyl-CoA transferase
VLVLQHNRIAKFAQAIGRPDILTDPRFSDPAKLAVNMAALAAILDEIFQSKPMSHWSEKLAEIDVTFGVVNGPEEVINDPQLAANDIVVPLENAGSLKSTISSPFQVHGVAKVPARRGPALGEHTEEILHELGFDDKSIASLREEGALPEAPPRAA